MLRLPAECVVCGFKHVALAKQIKASTGEVVDLYYCMDCESFFSPYAPTHLNGSTLGHQKRAFERNVGWVQGLFDLLAPHMGKPSFMLDVGCGIGALLHGARTLGINGVGYDRDEEACEYGRKSYGLDLRGEEWRAGAYDSNKIDLISCIMVLEQVPWPRPLLHQILLQAKSSKAHVYVSTPWFDRPLWTHLSAPEAEGSPLCAPYVRVTHCSQKGFEKACRGMGVTMLQPIRHPWPGFLLRCD